MRILVTFVGGLGHLAPLLPLARAAHDAGHDVAIAGSGGLVAHVEDAGLTAYATSPPPHHAQAPDSRERTPLEVMGARATEAEFADNFAERGARRMAAALPEVLRDFGPDLVLRDETDLGTTIAAEVHGVPVATHVVLASGLLIRPELVAPRLDVLRAEHGLPPDPDLTRLTSGPVLSTAAPSFLSPDATLPLAPLHYRAGDAPLPRTPSDRPRVYATLGTIFNKGSGDLFERLVAGLGMLDAEVLLTVGRDLDPRDVGPAPEHVRVERFVPHDEAVGGADVVVHHGGSGSLMTALAHGLPSVLLPLGADQPHNARRARELGVAEALDAASATPTAIGLAVGRALADASMRQRCERVAAELRALPGVGCAVAALHDAAQQP
jgi:UDP:flavonoid glycosyltransferase YjiC (YdhE family)